MSAPGNGVRGVVTISAGPRRRVGGKVYVGAPAGGSRFPSGEVEIAIEFLDSLRPRGAGSSGNRPSQIVHLSARVQGFFANNAEIVPHGDLLNLSVERSAEGGATATFEVRADNPPFGTEIGWKGAAPGKREVSIFAGYATAAGVRGGAYASRMIADVSKRQVGGDGPNVMTITCLDPKFRDDKKKVTYIRDQGHGLTPEAIIRDLAFLGMDLGPTGVPLVNIGDGTTPIHKAIQLDCEPWLPHAEQLAESVGKALYRDRHGILTLVPRTPPPSQRPVMTLTEADILAGAKVEITGMGTEVPTSVIITGETVTKPEECGIEVQTLQVSVFEDPVFFPAAAFRQLSGPVGAPVGGGLGEAGDLVPTGGVGFLPITGRQEVHRTVRMSEVKCGTIISERVIVWEWKNPEVNRYVIGDDGEVVRYGAPSFESGGPQRYIFNTEAEKDDSSPVFAWHRPRFVPVYHSYKVFDYGGHGLNVHPTTVRVIPTNLGDFRIENLGVKAPVGALIKARTWVSGYYYKKAALKAGPLATGQNWEERGFIPNTRVLGSGQAVATSQEAYIGTLPIWREKTRWNPAGLVGLQTSFWVSPIGHAEYHEESFEVTPEGNVESKREESEEFFVVPGGDYWFGNNLTSRFQFEGGPVPQDRARLTRSTKVTSYSAQEGGGGHTSIAAETDNERSPPVTKTTIQDHEGDLPRATFMSDPDRQIETQRFELEVESAALLQSHVAYELEYSNPYLEDPTQAEKVALMLLREGSALQASFLLPANVVIDPWQLVHLYLRRYGINFQVHVMTTGLQWPGWGEAVLTPVTGKVYVV